MRSSDEGLVHAMPVLLIVLFGRLTLPGKYTSPSCVKPVLYKIHDGYNWMLSTNNKNKFLNRLS